MTNRRNKDRFHTSQTTRGKNNTEKKWTKLKLPDKKRDSTQKTREHTLIKK